MALYSDHIQPGQDVGELSKSERTKLYFQQFAPNFGSTSGENNFYALD